MKAACGRCRRRLLGGKAEQQTPLANRANTTSKRSLLVLKRAYFNIYHINITFTIFQHIPRKQIPNSICSTRPFPSALPSRNCVSYRLQRRLSSSVISCIRRVSSISSLPNLCDIDSDTSLVIISLIIHGAKIGIISENSNNQSFLFIINNIFAHVTTL